MGRALKIVLIILLVIVLLVLVAYLAPLIAVLCGAHGKVYSEPQVVVVFGYKLESEMPSLLKSRLDAAISYLEEHPDVPVIVTGGKGDGEKTSEAQCMRDYLVQNGVDASRVIMEDKSATTAENIRFTLEIIDEMGVDREDVLLVSNEFHLTRIRMMYKRATDVKSVSTLAAKSYPTSKKALMYLREPFALLIDFLFTKF